MQSARNRQLMDKQCWGKEGGNNLASSVKKGEMSPLLPREMTYAKQSLIRFLKIQKEDKREKEEKQWW